MSFVYDEKVSYLLYETIHSFVNDGKVPYSVKGFRIHCTKLLMGFVVELPNFFQPAELKKVPYER